MGSGPSPKAHFSWPEFACVAALIFAVQSAHGQVPSGQSQDTTQLLGTRASPTYGPSPTPSGEAQGYAVASPSDQDIGKQQILKQVAEYKPFTVSVYSPFFYTTNVALVSRNEEDDFLVAPGVTLLYQPQITSNLYGELGVVQQFFLYDRFTELNFGSFDAVAGVAYYLPQFHNLSLRARYDYNRLTDTDHFDEFFVNHSIILNADMPFRIGRAQQLSLGVTLNLSFYANPDPPQRNDYSFYVGYDLALSRSFSIAATARLAVRDYHVGDRTDVSEILSLSANYRVRDWLILSALSSFAWNESNHSVFDYNVANVGGGVTLTLKF